METRSVPNNFRLMVSDYPELPKGFIPRFSTIQLYPCTPADGLWVTPASAIIKAEMELPKKRMRLAPVNVRDYFLENYRRIPKQWSGKTIFFGADTYEFIDRSPGEYRCYYMIPGMKQYGVEWIHVYRERFASFTPNDYLAVCAL